MADTLITLSDPRSSASEAYRTLRANLTQLDPHKPLTAFAVSAAARADGKSTAAANLAVTFAQAGHKTILVDADLRHPSQHTLWGVPNTTGLAALFGDDTLLANPPFHTTAVPNLSVLTAGSADGSPSDLFASPRFADIVGLLKARAHFIIFDVPPVLAVSDALVLGGRVDGVLLVVRAGSTRRDHVQRAREALERAHVRVLGAALTNAPREKFSYP
jgi:non-specific protein-tyrosine kinase